MFLTPQDLEDLVLAYEEMEDEQVGEIQQMQYKLNTSLLTSGANTSTLCLNDSALATLQVSPAADNRKRVVSFL